MPAIKDLERSPGEVEHQVAFGLVEQPPDLIAIDPTHRRAVSQEGRSPPPGCQVGTIPKVDRQESGNARDRDRLGDLPRSPIRDSRFLFEVYSKNPLTKRVRPRRGWPGILPFTQESGGLVREGPEPAQPLRGHDWRRGRPRLERMT